MQADIEPYFITNMLRDFQAPLDEEEENNGEEPGEEEENEATGPE